jgi:hypothetical protein
MTTEQNIIRAKVGLLELAKQLGNVTQACKIMGYSRDDFYLYGRLSLCKSILKKIRFGPLQIYPASLNGIGAPKMGNPLVHASAAVGA